ncbi:MAG: glutaredoxin family protein [Burkholderiales bacterium]|nr:glutaredoxin family protein [Burkholderiales bacterium]
MPVSRRQWTLALLLGSLAGATRAETLEQRFRGYLDRLRSQGRQLIESPLRGLAEVRQPVITQRTDKLPLGTGNFAIIVGPGCITCRQAIDHLRAKKIDFAVLDMATSDTARQTHAHLGATGVPVILLPTQMMVGFTPAKFNEAMALDNQKQMSDSAGSA